ncbi:MAG: KOW motif-containing protein, partial [Prevotella sp.]
TEERLNLALASPANAYLSYYYDHFRTDADGKNPPLIVPDKQMDNFIHLTSIDNDHILFVDRSQCHFKSGDHVVVTDGDFRGIEGRIARVSRQQRVVVELDGIGCITTAYIPKAFLRVKGK